MGENFRENLKNFRCRSVDVSAAVTFRAVAERETDEKAADNHGVVVAGNRTRQQNID